MHAPRRDFDGIRERVYRSRFFVFALFLHVAAIAMFATFVVIPEPMQNTVMAIFDPNSPETSSGPRTIPTPHIPEADIPLPAPPEVSLPEAGSDNSFLEETGRVAREVFTTTGNAVGLPIRLPGIGKSEGMSTAPGAPTSPARKPAGPPRIEAITETVNKWIEDYNLPPRGNPSGTFPIYLARYADGDWNTGTALREGKIVAGPLVNAARMIERLSRGRLTLTVAEQPLNLDSPELVQKMPPFIFLTGHKDFHLTEAEVRNLRIYLWKGGAIWGDNGLAGRGSRFDVAFRREMKRVLPDDDIAFEPVPVTHPLFTASSHRFKAPPSGMNFFQEPLEMIRLEGKLAVLYTPNNYNDLMRMALKDDDATPRFGHREERDIFTPHAMWHNRSIYYRNFEPASSVEAYRFAHNIIHHLLVRFRPDAGFWMD